MNLLNYKIIYVSLFGCLVSLIGTVIGSFIAISFKKPSQKVLASILGFSGGLMLSVVMFDLIPESIQIWGLFKTIFFCLAGIFGIAIIDQKMTFNENDKGLKVGIMTAIALAMHNFPEGIIMGCGFALGSGMGLKMSLIIAIHDIPEGLAVASPLMISEVKPLKIIVYSFLTALPTMVGALIGIYVSKFSSNILGLCISTASGIMLYVVCGEMLPQVSKIWNGITSTIGILMGIMLGLVIIKIL